MPPHHPSSTPSALDQLLTEYLHALDRYTALRAQLAEELSTGFLSLARARFRSSPAAAHFGIGSAALSGSAARPARLRARIVEASAAELGWSVEVAKIEPRRANAKDGGRDADGDDATEDEARDADEAKGGEGDADERKGRKGDAEEAKAEKHAEAEDAPGAPDPLRVFGLIPPSGLRDSQIAFERAVRGPVAELVGVAAELRGLEQRVEAERARLGTTTASQVGVAAS